MRAHRWKVVPICEDQRRDVSPEDLVWVDGEPLFRLCSTYKGGGGYDQFPKIAHRRGKVGHPDLASKQYVVQLYGCNLDCPFCYVTRKGVWDAPVRVTTENLVKHQPPGTVFHLMGGAPALQLKFWPELLDALPTTTLFHSDLMLTESEYKRDILDLIRRPNVLLAVSIKGYDAGTFERNTNKKLDRDLLHSNLDTLRDYPELWYYTFTNVPRKETLDVLDYMPNDFFHIDLIDYNAMPHVYNRPWGGAAA